MARQARNRKRKTSHFCGDSRLYHLPEGIPPAAAYRTVCGRLFMRGDLDRVTTNLQDTSCVACRSSREFRQAEIVETLAGPVFTAFGIVIPTKFYRQRSTRAGAKRT